jgi:hypothetical protein
MRDSVACREGDPCPVCPAPRRRTLVLRAAGDSYKEIAEKLGVTYTKDNVRNVLN